MRVVAVGPKAASPMLFREKEKKNRCWGIAYYLRVEPMILLKLAREAAIPGRSEGGIALKCTTKYLPPTGPIDLRPGGAVPKPCPPKKSPRAFFVQNQQFL